MYSFSEGKLLDKSVGLQYDKFIMAVAQAELRRVGSGKYKEAVMSCRRLLKVAAFVALTLATMASGGCIKIQVVDSTPGALEATPLPEEAVEEHDLAVLAVDFDPPLVYEEIVARRNRGEGITLLVAVENAGVHTEQDVSVEVELSKDGGETAILYKEGRVDTIAPGEIKIVQFKDADIPFSYAYTLRVDVIPVAGETRLHDNQKQYDLLITQP